MCVVVSNTQGTSDLLMPIALKLLSFWQVLGPALLQPGGNLILGNLRELTSLTVIHRFLDRRMGSESPIECIRACFVHEAMIFCIIYVTIVYWTKGLFMVEQELQVLLMDVGYATSDERR